MSLNEPFSAQDFLEAYRNNDRQLRKYLHVMETEWKPYIAQSIKTSGGTEADVEDVFYESIYELVANLGSGSFRGESLLKTYFTQICKFKWMGRVRKDKRREEIREEVFGKPEEAIHPSDNLISYQEITGMIGNLLDDLGDLCKEILTLWSLGHSYDEILTMTDIKSTGTARKRKFDCVEKLQKLISARPALRSQLMDYLKSLF